MALRHSCGLSKWTEGGGGEKAGEGDQDCSKLVSVGSVLKFTAQNKKSCRKHHLMQS